MFSFEQRCPLCAWPIIRGQTTALDPDTEIECHAGCVAVIERKKEYSDNG